MRRYLAELNETLSQLFTPVVKWTIIVSLTVFLLSVFGLARWIVPYGGASFNGIFRQYLVFQPLTYVFIHGSFLHLFFNLFALYMFGTRLESRWGTTTTVRFFIAAGAGAVLTHLAVTALLTLARPEWSPLLGIPIIGASGIVYAVLMAYALYYPDEIVYLQFLIPIKVKYLVAILGLLTLASAADFNSPVAQLTHLGGLIFGFLFVRWPGLFDWIPVPRLRRGGPRIVRGGGGRFRDF